jgi:hypothetical protein
MGLQIYENNPTSDLCKAVGIITVTHHYFHFLFSFYGYFRIRTTYHFLKKKRNGTKRLRR